MRRANHDRVELAEHVEVVGESPVAGQQPLISLAANRPADPSAIAAMSIAHSLPVPQHCFTR
jgi:hypothetical protein